MMQWIEPDPVQVPQKLADYVGGHRLLSEALVRRGITDVDVARAFLDPDEYYPTHASTLPDLIKAASRLHDAINARERILVWGDFDVDGQTATTLLVSALENIGSAVDFHIPIRKTESHGITIPKLDEYLKKDYDLLITCDTGISEFDAVEYASARGVDVIITDHHELPPELPKAFAVIDPKLLQENHPLRDIPGVGVAYKLIEGLYDRFGFFEEAEQFLDLVALGIVADVANLSGDNRYLLQRGINRLRMTERVGLQVLLENINIDLSDITEEKIGFYIAPRLNAMGRLADANPIVEFLTTTDLGRARVLADQLEALNAQRKLLQDQVSSAAIMQLEKNPELLDYPVLVMSYKDWPAGVLGLVAGKLAAEFNRPAVLLTEFNDGMARGSARSVEGVNITEAFSKNAKMLHSFGGHAGAAGLSIERERLPAFRRALSDTIVEMVGDVLPEPTLLIDGFLLLVDLTPDLVEDLERLAPFGPGNPSITLATHSVQLKSQSELGRSGEHLQYIVEDSAGTTLRVIRWGGAGKETPSGTFDLAYTVSMSEYRGKRDLQVLWVDARPVEESDEAVQLPSIEIIDGREDPSPRDLLDKFLSDHEAEIWAEGDVEIPSGGKNRTNLGHADALVIWTSPPNPGVLMEVLSAVSPAHILVFAHDPGVSTLSSFLEKLTGLVKFVINNRSGNTTYTELATAMAQTETAVGLGIAWLTAKGETSVRLRDDGGILISKGIDKSEDAIQSIGFDLRAQLMEVAAYRRYFTRGSTQNILQV